MEEEGFGRCSERYVTWLCCKMTHDSSKPVKVSIVKGTEPQIEILGEPPSKKWEIYQQITVIQHHSAPRMDPSVWYITRMACRMWCVMCCICFQIIIHIYIYSCAFLHKYYLISQILNVWSIYLHLGSLGVNVGIYTSPNERLGKWIWFVCVHHKWCKSREKKSKLEPSGKPQSSMDNWYKGWGSLVIMWIVRM